MNIDAIITKINGLESAAKIRAYAADLFDAHMDVDDSILDAIEARLQILHKPSERDVACENLTKGYKKFNEHDQKRNYSAASRQAKKNKQLQAIYDSL